MSKGTKGYKRERGLTIEQQNAIDVLVQGATDQEAADVAGVHRVTVTKWRNYDPFFQAELNRRRQAVWGAAVDRLRSLLPRALDTLEEELQSGQHRWRVALDVLRLSGLDRGGNKKDTIGSYLVGQTDPDAIVDSIARSSRPDPLNEFFNGKPVTEAERLFVMADLDRLLEAG